MASADTWFEAHDDDDDGEAYHLTPLRRSVVAGVRAVIAHLQTQRAEQTQMPRHQRKTDAGIDDKTDGTKGQGDE